MLDLSQKVLTHDQKVITKLHTAYTVTTYSQKQNNKLLTCFFFVILKFDSTEAPEFFAPWSILYFFGSFLRIMSPAFIIFFWKLFNPFHATGLFLYPLKTSKNLRFSDVFRGYRKRPMAWNGLNSLMQNISFDFLSLPW